MEGPRRQNVRGIHARFLRQNPRFINAPICNINYSLDCDASAPECMQWPHVEKSKDSERKDSKDTSISAPTIKPKFHKAPKTIVQELLSDPKEETSNRKNLKEYISFKHQYNCRKDPNEPVRGKLHGSFICEQ